jgi:hypothetical protein
MREWLSTNGQVAIGDGGGVGGVDFGYDVGGGIDEQAIRTSQDF